MPAETVRNGVTVIYCFMIRVLLIGLKYTSILMLVPLTGIIIIVLFHISWLLKIALASIFVIIAYHLERP